MAMGKRGGEQDDLFVARTELPRSDGHPFYRALDRELRAGKFDEYVEELCARFYHPSLGRPGLAPGLYFRCLFIGYFEGIDSERGIAWRVADSLSLRDFLGLGLGTEPPDHSTISRTRRLVDLESHQAVFRWVLQLLARKDLVKGKTLGVDSTTLEANAALRSIVRRDSGQTYEEFLTALAKASGIETPTREDLARIDKKRPKKGSNEDWVHPGDPDAQITKMKDGSTHLAHKQEHAVDMDTGAVVAVTVQGAVDGDCASIEGTLEKTFENLDDVRKDDEAREKVSARVEDVVADKGYHSDSTLMTLEVEGVRSYISEPERGRRRWKGKPAAKRAVYRNRRRKSGARGQRLRRRRGELLERTFAHTLETGGMRRVHLRARANILKRVLIHVAAFDLGLLMRKLIGVGTPRGLQKKHEALQDALAATLMAFLMLLGRFRHHHARPAIALARRSAGWTPFDPRGSTRGFTTGC
jgi:transposase